MVVRKQPDTPSSFVLSHAARVHREAYLGQKMDRLAAEAKTKLASGDKKAALMAMKKRKLYEAEIAKITNVKMTLETQAINLESAAGTADAFQAMNAGNNTMQKIRNDMGGVEKVDDVMMDMQDEFQMQEEVSNAIGQSVDPMFAGMDMNDDDLMKELEGLGGDMTMGLAEKFDAAEGKLSPAGPPKRKPLWNKSPSKKEADELSKLEAELAIAS